MLLETKKIEENKYALKCAFEGSTYESALLNYPIYVPKHLQRSYDNNLFEKGKTPNAVNEEFHCDDLYRYIFKHYFMELYHEAINVARLEDGYLENIEIDYFSSERILFTLIITTQKDSNNDSHQSDPLVVLDNYLDDISNVDKLQIFSKVKRDESFWQYLRSCCHEFQQSISKEIIPILAKIGVVTIRNNEIWVDANSDNMLRSFYPIIEATIYISAVFNAALQKYIYDFSYEDKINIDKYLFSTVSQLIDQFPGNNQILIERLQEYNHACQKNMFSGYSLYGQFNKDFDGLRGWSQNQKVKCAHLLCDHIAYIEHFGELSSYDDLEKLRPIVISNSSQTLNNYMELFDILYGYSGSIFMIVRSTLNDARRIKWKAEGLCQHCGSEFKRSLFGTKCSNCKVKKDY